MRKLLTLAMVLSALLIAVPVSAGRPVTLVVDDGVDCPDTAYTTVQAAVDAASGGETIVVCTGTYAGAEVDKAVHIQARGNVVINSGPQPHSFTRAGFYFPPGGAGSGSTIRGFRFEGTPQFDYVDDGHLDFAIFSRGADNVTVEHNVMVDTLQAITNWNGSGWTIQHNKIEGLWVLCGGGIGILVGAFDGTQANGNLIAHNTIEADVSPDCGFYTTSGITIYSDTRWGAAGGPIEENRVLHNRSRVTGTWDDPDEGILPAADGFEFTDGGLLNEYPWSGDGNPDVTGNTVAFNDFRGSSIEMYFSPEPKVEENNTVTRNLGKNRGHGVTPASNLFR